ncbi:MAG: hypothetical protein K6T83_01245 [Alicyclobacillus sp.]|nr:hypothetical protein [Alicyclobacillus sp.]
MVGTLYPGNAGPRDVRAGKTFSAGTNYNVAGTLQDNGNGKIWTPTTTDQTIAAGIWDTANTVKGDPNLVPQNILSGVQIFGVTGNVVPKRYASGTATVSSQTLSFNLSAGGGTDTNSYVEVSGLTFLPSLIYVVEYSAGTLAYPTVYSVNTYGIVYSNRHYNVQQSVAYVLDGTNAYVNSSGFRLPNGGSGDTVKWEAWE